MKLLRNEVILSMGDEKENLNVGNDEIATDTTAVADDVVSKEEPSVETTEETQPTTFTQEQVNDIVRDRLKKSNEAFYKRFGVTDDEGLNGLFEKAKTYDELKNSYDQAVNELKSCKEQLTLNGNNILADRRDDVLTYFKGKGLELNDESLKEALKTHPEWAPQAVKATTVVPMGSDRSQLQQESDEDKALRLFGLDKFVK